MSSEIPVQTAPMTPVEADDTQVLPVTTSDVTVDDDAVTVDRDAVTADRDAVTADRDAVTADRDAVNADHDAVTTGQEARDTDDGIADELASDPFTDDLSTELATAAGTRWRNRATVALGAVALIVVGFLGGVLVQKNFGSSSSAARNNTGRTGFAGGNFPGGFNRGGTGTGGAGTGGTGSRTGGSTQTGTIVLVDGTTIYVKLASGDTVTVKTSGDTKVSLASTAKVGSLKKGQQVTFAGSTDSSTGTVTATSVTASK
jgi:hypothetical protein